MTQANIAKLAAAIEDATCPSWGRQRRSRLHAVHEQMRAAGVPRGHWLWESYQEAEYQLTARAF